MRCFNSRQLAIVLLALIITACAGPSKKTGKPEATPEPEATATEGDGANNGFVVLPNPYVPGEVPPQAVNEHKKIIALMQAKKWNEAEGALQIMTTTFPSLSGPYINLGVVYTQLGQLDEAEKALLFAIDTNPQNMDAYTQLGFVYREQGKFAQAEENYLKALAIWPHHLPSAMNLGILYDLYMGRLQDALKYYELSQNIKGGDDRQLKGWIADISRRIDK